MTRLLLLIVCCGWATTAAAQDSNQTVVEQIYFPGDWGAWETRLPEQVGMDADRLQAAVDYAHGAVNKGSRDLTKEITAAFGKEPFFRIMGPVKPRENSSGIIVRQGYIVAEWGDTNRVDMTFSVTKSYLSTVAGLALDDRIIRDITAPVADSVRDGTFDDDHNRSITWEHLLQQTSDWSGTLWEQPDWGDRPVGSSPQEWEQRQLHEPGTHFKYNDVRVNLLASSLLQIYRRPLPVILRERIMNPIGASPTWRWHGYDNSWVTLDGQRMQSVSGGGHWGGGLFICTRDHARFGYLFLRNGRWKDQQLLSERWMKLLQQPAQAKADYGAMWWLNTDRARIPAAPASSFYAAGFGGNYIYVDRENDLLIVLRWTPDLAGVVERVLSAKENAQ